MRLAVLTSTFTLLACGVALLTTGFIQWCEHPCCLSLSNAEIMTRPPYTSWAMCCFMFLTTIDLETEYSSFCKHLQKKIEILHSILRRYESHKIIITINSNQLYFVTLRAPTQNCTLLIMVFLEFFHWKENKKCKACRICISQNYWNSSS